MKSKNSKKFTETVEEDEPVASEMDEEDEIESEHSEMENDCNLDASATDSDEDESEPESNNASEVKRKSKIELIKEELIQRYKDRQGKQLYIRFPHKVPETQEALEEKIKELSDLVVKVHKPRQRHARFCLVDFATNEDRNKTLKKLKTAIKTGDLKKYVVSIPLTEREDLVNELAERKVKSIENKKAKCRLKKATKKALVEKNFTSSIVVLNLPKTTSLAQLRELFPNAVDIQIKPGKGKLHKDKSIGAITLPTTLDARKATTNKLSLGGNKLIIKFDNQKIKKKLKSKNNSTAKVDIINSESESKITTPNLESSDKAEVNSKKKNKKIKKSSTKSKIKKINKTV